MFSSVQFLVWSLVIAATSQQKRPAPRPGSGDTGRGDSGRGDGGSGDDGSVGSPFLCSAAGNCTCQSGDTVTCTSVGNNLNEIAKKLPKTTTHL